MTGGKQCGVSWDASSGELLDDNRDIIIRITAYTEHCALFFVKIQFLFAQIFF